MSGREPKNADADIDDIIDPSLKFGHTFEATYQKHGILGITDVFWNPHMK